MGDSVLTAVQNFYDTYGEATYKQWQSLAADYDKADIAYNKKKLPWKRQPMRLKPTA